jgi:hypothetical protein
MRCQSDLVLFLLKVSSLHFDRGVNKTLELLLSDRRSCPRGLFSWSSVVDLKTARLKKKQKNNEKLKYTHFLVLRD